VLFVLGALVGGVAVGALLGGSVQRLERLGLRRLRLLGAAVGIQLIGTIALGGSEYVVTIAASLVLACAFIVANPQLPGRELILAGLALNALVIVVNGAMPVSPTAAAHAGVNLAALAGDPRHMVDAHAYLAWLGDRIPLALPWQPQVLSIGDVLVAAGVGLLIANGMRRGVESTPDLPIRPAAIRPVRPVSRTGPARTSRPGR
jgi:Family of unknown function (DUF5317)